MRVKSRRLLCALMLLLVLIMEAGSPANGHAAARAYPAAPPVCLPAAANPPPVQDPSEPHFNDASFKVLWERFDKPVADQKVSRSWLWGDKDIKDGVEPYKEGPSGVRTIEYFDKARMEVNCPLPTAQQGPWYATNGLLPIEMMTGRVQLGDSISQPTKPSGEAIAGDNIAFNPGAPTYASFAHVATLNDTENQAPDNVGQQANLYLNQDDSVTTGDNHGVNYLYYDPQLKHNIASVFWIFMNQSGSIYDSATGGYLDASPLFNWTFVLGFPISEPYWTTVKVGGQRKLVLIQAFQRRVLTYTPSNDPAWQVEMGNVGRNYYDWRHKAP